jgi:ABC-2 type transport system permease protein
MSPLLALALKDLRLLSRDRMDLFFTLVFPLFVAIFFGSIFGGGGSDKTDTRIDIALTDLDHSPASERLAAKLSTGGDFKVQEVPTAEDGEALVRGAKVAASVVIPEGFADATQSVFRGQPITLEGSIDPSKRAEAGMIQGLLTKYAFGEFGSLFSDSGAMRHNARQGLDALRSATDIDPARRENLERFLADLDRFYKDQPEGADAGGGFGSAGFEPVKVDLTDISKPAATGGPANAYVVSFPQAIVWGVLGAVMSFVVSLTSERTGGTLLRLLVSPLRRWQIMAGKSVACFVTTVAVCVLILILGWLWFGVRPQSPALLAFAILCIGLGFVGIMMLLAGLSKTAAGASGMARGALLMLAMIGGGSIPVMYMPTYMKTVSAVSPFRWAIDALEGALWRGWSPMQMLTPCAVLLGMGAAGFMIGAAAFRASTDR